MVTCLPCIGIKLEKSVLVVTKSLAPIPCIIALAAPAALHRASLAVLVPVFLGHQAGLNLLTTNSSNNKPIGVGHPEGRIAPMQCD